MDYSKVKFVTPSVDGKYFTKGKVYAFEFKKIKRGHVTDDDGDERFIFIPECAHLDNNPWIPCHEYGTPLTKELTALEADMLDLLKEWVASELGRSTVLESKTKRLIKKAKQ